MVFGIDTVVTFTLAPTASGTLLSLVHSGFTPDQKGAFGGTRYGWKTMGARLVDLLARLPEAVNTSFVVVATLSPVNAPPPVLNALKGERDNVTEYVSQLPESPDPPMSTTKHKEAALRIKWTKLYVDDQEKALQFYTDRLGFVKKADFSQGNYRWLTVASPEDPDGAELQLESNANPAGKAYQKTLRSQDQPAAQFQVSDLKAEHDRLAARGVKFTTSVTSATGSLIAVLDDTCGNLIQLVQLTWE